MEDLDGRQGGVVCFSQGSILLIRMMLMRLVLLHETNATRCYHNQQLYKYRICSPIVFAESQSLPRDYFADTFLNLFDTFGA